MPVRPSVRDDDATVVIRRPPPPRPGRRGPWLVGGGAAALAVLLLAAVWGLWLRPAPPPLPPHVAPPAVRPAPPPVVAPPARHRAAGRGAARSPHRPLLRRRSPPPPAPFAIATADEAAIRDHVATALTVFRFAPDPRIVVLDFPTLHEQGAMLNRVAALVEKAGLPRDRVLDDAELAAAIKAGGDTPDTYYFGHDYSAAELARFFALADAGHVALDAEEQKLRALLGELGWFAPGATGGLITIPRAPQDEVAALDAAARATILHHELSHGLFFSDPGYAAYVRQFWLTALTERRARRHPHVPRLGGLRHRRRGADVQRGARLPDVHRRPALLQGGESRHDHGAAAATRGGIPARHAAGLAARRAGGGPADLTLIRRRRRRYFASVSTSSSVPATRVPACCAAATAAASSRR